LIEKETPVHQTRHNKTNTITTKVPTYMFTIHISDDSDETDVIVHDTEGQYFLGGSKGPNATKFIGSEKHQEDAENRLKEYISNMKFIDFYLWTYKVPLITPTDTDGLGLGGDLGDLGILTSSYDDVENNSIGLNTHAKNHQYVTRVKLVHTTIVEDSK